MQRGISTQKINIKVSERINSLNQRRATKDSPLTQKNRYWACCPIPIKLQGSSSHTLLFPGNRHTLPACCPKVDRKCDQCCDEWRYRQNDPGCPWQNSIYIHVTSLANHPGFPQISTHMDARAIGSAIEHHENQRPP
jgi:hypothetical protein